MWSKEKTHIWGGAPGLTCLPNSLKTHLESRWLQPRVGAQASVTWRNRGLYCPDFRKMLCPNLHQVGNLHKRIPIPPDAMANLCYHPPHHRDFLPAPPIPFYCPCSWKLYVLTSGKALWEESSRKAMLPLSILGSPNCQLTFIFPAGCLLFPLSPLPSPPASAPSVCESSPIFNSLVWPHHSTSHF